MRSTLERAGEGTSRLISSLQTLGSAVMRKSSVGWYLDPAWQISCKILEFPYGEAHLFTDRFSEPVIERASSWSPKYILINLCFLF